MTTLGSICLVLLLSVLALALLLNRQRGLSTELEQKVDRYKNRLQEETVRGPLQERESETQGSR